MDKIKQPKEDQALVMNILKLTWDSKNAMYRVNLPGDQSGQYVRLEEVMEMAGEHQEETGQKVEELEQELAREVAIAENLRCLIETKEERIVYLLGIVNQLVDALEPFKHQNQVPFSGFPTYALELGKEVLELCKTPDLLAGRFV